MKKIIYTLGLLVFMTSCFHKSLENGAADDIEKALIYHGTEGDFLVTVENIFQATSKSSGNGINYTSGYSELRISSYNVANGEMMARKVLGEQIDENCTMLGWSDGNIWLYSLEEGLHSRNPKTLEINFTQETIFNKNLTLGGNLATCEWYQIPQYFSFEYASGRMIITDNAGFHYSLDPVSFESEVLKNDYVMPSDFSLQYLGTIGELGERDISLSGDLRKQVLSNYKEIDSELSYLDGKLIIDQNFESVYNRINKQCTDLKIKCDSLTSVMDSLTAIYGEATWKYPADIRKQNYALESELRLCTNDYEAKERDYNSLTERNSMLSINCLLSPDTNTFFIASKSNTSKDALLNIACMELRDNILTQKWSIVLPDVFYNASNASETDSFKRVFSKGNPQFDFTFFDLSDKKLVLIYMLHAFCIDIDSGKVLWNFKF